MMSLWLLEAIFEAVSVSYYLSLCLQLISQFLYQYHQELFEDAHLPILEEYLDCFIEIGCFHFNSNEFLHLQIDLD